MTNNTETLEARYRKYAEDYGVAYTSHDYKRTNRNHDKLHALLPELRATVDRGEGILRRLMADQSDAVATWAATHSLPVAEKDALATLEAIAKKGGMIGFGAGMVIKEWKSGRLVID